MHLSKRINRVLRDEGLSGALTRISDRVNPKPLATHLYIFGLEDCKSATIVKPGIDVEFDELEKGDEGAIDELTEIDEWRIPRSVTVQNLEAEWRCYIGRHAGRIVATVWTFLGREFEDGYLQRKFTLSPNEAYFYRCFCVPAFRGMGVLPYVWAYTCRNVLPGQGKTLAVAFTRRQNKPMFRGYKKMGWYPMGRLGMIRIFGIRFNYLWSPGAFKETKGRFSIQRWQ
jgi:hypothetical protein